MPTANRPFTAAWDPLARPAPASRSKSFNGTSSSLHECGRSAGGKVDRGAARPADGQHLHLRAGEDGIGIRACLIDRARKRQVGDRRQLGTSHKRRAGKGGFASNVRKCPRPRSSGDMPDKMAEGPGGAKVKTAHRNGAAQDKCPGVAAGRNAAAAAAAVLPIPISQHHYYAIAGSQLPTKPATEQLRPAPTRSCCKLLS
jgi:hypothetical protein